VNVDLHFGWSPNSALRKNDYKDPIHYL